MRDVMWLRVGALAQKYFNLPDRYKIQVVAPDDNHRFEFMLPAQDFGAMFKQRQGAEEAVERVELDRYGTEGEFIWMGWLPKSSILVVQEDKNGTPFVQTEPA